MKKVLQSKIFLIIICELIFTSIGVYGATLYKASDITYEARDASWEVSNVNEAINSLYDIQKNSVKKPVVFTSSPVDMTQYTDKWSELTTSDFVSGFSTAVSNTYAVKVNSAGVSTTASVNSSFSYDATTGTLTFSNSLSDANTVYQNSSQYASVSLTGHSHFVVWLGTINGQ